MEVDYNQKYLKYKYKYFQLKNQLGGIVKDEPYLIYIIGHQESNINKQQFMCTLLSQLKFYNLQDIKSDRIKIIHGSINNEESSKKFYCNIRGELPQMPGEKTQELFGRQPPINQSYNDLLKYNGKTIEDKDYANISFVGKNTNISTLISTLLKANCNSKTPIILVYDGKSDKNGDMIIYNMGTIQKILRPIDIVTIFDKYSQNPKLFILTQCKSISFETILQKLKNYTAILSDYKSSADGKTSQCIFGYRILAMLSSYDYSQISKFKGLLLPNLKIVGTDYRISTFYKYPKTNLTSLLNRSVRIVCNKKLLTYRISYDKNIDIESNLYNSVKLFDKYQGEDIINQSINIISHDNINYCLDWKIVKSGDVYSISTAKQINNKHPGYLTSNSVNLVILSFKNSRYIWWIIDAVNNGFTIKKLNREEYLSISTDNKGNYYPDPITDKNKSVWSIFPS